MYQRTQVLCMTASVAYGNSSEKIILYSGRSLLLCLSDTGSTPVISKTCNTQALNSSDNRNIGDSSMVQKVCVSLCTSTFWTRDSIIIFFGLYLIFLDNFVCISKWIYHYIFSDCFYFMGSFLHWFFMKYFYILVNLLLIIYRCEIKKN